MSHYLLTLPKFHIVKLPTNTYGTTLCPFSLHFVAMQLGASFAKKAKIKRKKIHSIKLFPFCIVQFDKYGSVDVAHPAIG